MDEKLISCPCKRVKCERHGNCKECTAHHQGMERKMQTACERLRVKEKRKKSAK